MFLLFIFFCFLVNTVIFLLVVVVVVFFFLCRFLSCFSSFSSLSYASFPLLFPLLTFFLVFLSLFLTLFFFSIKLNEVTHSLGFCLSPHQRPSVNMSSYWVEVDVTHGRRGNVIVIDTRQARVEFLRAQARFRPSVTTYDADAVDRGTLDHIIHREKTLYKRVNSHKGGPWMVAR